MPEFFIAGVGTALAICTLWLAWLDRDPAYPLRLQSGGTDQVKRSGFGQQSPSGVLAAASIALFITALALSGLTTVASRDGVDRFADSSTAAVMAGAEVASLEKYLARAGGGESPQQTPMPKADAAAALPDVDTMIARLASRLEQAPDDVEGWRTLGWSYLNTNRARDAVTAYERAASLAPQRTDIAEALQQARVTAGMNASGER